MEILQFLSKNKFDIFDDNNNSNLYKRRICFRLKSEYMTESDIPFYNLDIFIISDLKYRIEYISYDRTNKNNVKLDYVERFLEKDEIEYIILKFNN